MRALLMTSYKLGRKEAVAGLLARVVAGVEAAGGDARPSFYFEDMPIGAASGVARAAKRFKELASFVTTRADTKSPALTDFGPGWVSAKRDAPGGEVPMSTLAAVAAGIPRSFPFHYASFVWSNVPVLGDGASFPPLNPVQPDPRFASMRIAPGIALTSGWWTSGRLNGLLALTEVTPPARAGEPPVVPPAAAALLAALGKVEQTRVIPIVEPSEQEEAVMEVERLQEVVARFRAEADARLEALQFPHDLPPVAEVDSLREYKIGSMKGVLIDVFGRAGYRYESKTSGQGVYEMKKMTAAGSTLQLTFDVGTWSRSCTALFSWTGLRHSVTLRVPVSKRAALAMQYPITGLAQFRQIAENVAAAVHQVEETFVPEVETAMKQAG